MANNWKNDYARYKNFFLNVLQVYYAKPNIKIYLELILSLSTIIIFSIFAIKPTILTIVELNKEIKTKEETITKINQKLINLQKASDILQNEAGKLGKIEVSVPSSASPENIILEMERLANKNSLQILNLSISEVIIMGEDKLKKKGREDLEKLPLEADELPFTVSFSGSYQNIVLLISDIENQIRPVKIDSLTINTSITEGGKILTLTISGRLPFVEK
jgi:Tfp pilus assembly protein PilO